MSNRGSRGKGQQRLLYWFRTPPGVRVGRSALDEEAIRLLEQHNPDIQFDWSRILREPPPPQPRKDERRGRDRRGAPREARPATPTSPRQAAEPPARATEYTERPEEVATEYTEYTERPEEVATEYTEYTGRPEEVATEYTEYTGRPEEVATDYTEYTERPEEVATEHTEQGAAEYLASEAVERLEPLGLAAALEAEPLDAEPLEAEPPEPVPGEPREPRQPASPAEARVGAEGLARLRGRYAEVMARISERPLDEDTREQLKLRAERLNPDTWVTADEVAQALEVYESVYDELRAVVGTRHRRRRGRRRDGQR